MSLKEESTQPPADKNDNKLKELKILGNQKVGSKLSAQVIDTNDSTVSSGISYQWFRADTNDGTCDISISKDATYTLQPEDEGKYIKLIVTDTTDNSNTIFKYTEKIAKNDSSNNASSKIELKELKINGDQEVGKTLSAEVKDINNNVVNSELSYKWYRVDNKNGSNEILIGNNSTYTLQAEDEGKYIKLVVTDGANTIYDHTELIIKNINETKVVISELEIKGVTKPGNVLSAEIKDTKGNIVNSDVSYRWYRTDGKYGIVETLVSKEPTYTLQSADQGKYIKLLVGNKYSSLYTYTGMISRNSSSGGGSNSSGSSSSSTTENTTDNNTSIENINLNQGNIDSNVNASENKEVITIVKNENGQVQLKTEEGKPATGWQQVDGKWYLGDADGQAKTGWQQENGKWYLMSNSGEMTTGWQQTNDGKWYLMNNSGEMTTGWQQQNGKWYLMSNSGEMTTGWQKVDGKWYYLNSDGSMASNTYIDGYYVGNDGAWV